MSEKETYSFSCQCANCGKWQQPDDKHPSFEIPKGTTIRTFFHTQQNLFCIRCGCKLMPQSLAP